MEVIQKLSRSPGAVKVILKLQRSSISEVVVILDQLGSYRSGEDYAGAIDAIPTELVKAIQVH